MKKSWNKIKDKKDAWILVIFFVLVFLLASCTWKSPADHKREKLSIEHIHGPNCDHPAFRVGLI